jgi:hypothetical protein
MGKGMGAWQPEQAEQSKASTQPDTTQSKHSIIETHSCVYAGSRSRPRLVTDGPMGTLGRGRYSSDTYPRYHPMLAYAVAKLSDKGSTGATLRGG